jgi:hypothetical protein
MVIVMRFAVFLALLANVGFAETDEEKRILEIVGAYQLYGLSGPKVPSVVKAYGPSGHVRNVSSEEVRMVLQMLEFRIGVSDLYLLIQSHPTALYPVRAARLRAAIAISDYFNGRAKTDKRLRRGYFPPSLEFIFDEHLKDEGARTFFPRSSRKTAQARLLDYSRRERELAADLASSIEENPGRNPNEVIETFLKKHSANFRSFLYPDSRAGQEPVEWVPAHLSSNLRCVPYVAKHPTLRVSPEGD